VTDTVLANAVKKRDILAQRMEEIKRELAKIDSWIAQWHEFAGEPLDHPLAYLDRLLPQDAGSAQQAPVVRHRTRPRAGANPKKEDVAEAARQIILDRGEPVSRADLFKALAERGMTIHSESDPEMVLSTMLWRTRDKVIRLKTGGYWLPERPWPAAGYVPGNRGDDDCLSTPSPEEQSDAFGGMNIDNLF
jgi:hypothetical protein